MIIITPKIGAAVAVATITSVMIIIVKEYKRI